MVSLSVTSLWVFFLPFYQRETTPVASVSCSPLKRRANSFLLEWTPIYKGSKTENDSCFPCESVLSLLQYIGMTQVPTFYLND